MYHMPCCLLGAYAWLNFLGACCISELCPGFCFSFMVRIGARPLSLFFLKKKKNLLTDCRWEITAYFRSLPEASTSKDAELWIPTDTRQWQQPPLLTPIKSMSSEPLCVQLYLEHPNSSEPKPWMAKYNHCIHTDMHTYAGRSFLFFIFRDFTDLQNICIRWFSMTNYSRLFWSICCRKSKFYSPLSIY
jgi:hypothetical protein